MLQHLIVHFLLFYLANGRLWGVKTIENNFKLLELSNSGCGRLREVPNIVIWLETFGILENWSLRRGLVAYEWWLQPEV